MNLARGLMLAAVLVALPAGATPFRDLVQEADPFARFLPVEQAFRVDARAIDANTVSVRWIATDPERWPLAASFTACCAALRASRESTGEGSGQQRWR